ncbi:MAG: HD domain-containing protein [Syntrophales bacterium]
MQKKSIYIRDIKAGEKICDTFLVAEKSLAFSQKGAPYLNVRLKDKTGELDGKVWDDATAWDKVFDKGDIIRIQSRSASYKNNIQLSIITVEKAAEGDISLNDYLPAARRSGEEMLAELMLLVESVQEPSLQALLRAFFLDAELVALFKRAPAAKGFHHVYLGGLLEHTLSVANFLSLACGQYAGVDRDLLLTGGILHDIGKIYEFSYDRNIEYTDEGRLVGHIVMGTEMVDKKIATLENFPPHLALKLRHIILSHHGDLEYGSPKRPKTVEALIVHFMDDLDAKVNAFQEFIAASPDGPSDWTPFHRLLERYIYKDRKADEPTTGD